MGETTISSRGILAASGASGEVDSVKPTALHSMDGEIALGCAEGGEVTVCGARTTPVVEDRISELITGNGEGV